MHIFVWYLLVTSWWSVCRLAFCSLYYSGLGFFGLFVLVWGFFLGGGEESVMLKLG